MKKLTLIMIAIVASFFLMTTSSMAGETAETLGGTSLGYGETYGSTNASGYASFNSDNTYNAKGNGSHTAYANGGSDADGSVDGGAFTTFGGSLSGVYSMSNVGSSADANSGGACGGYDTSSVIVSGTAYQGTHANANDTQAGAGGAQDSQASYNASSNDGSSSATSVSANGNAYVLGGTIAGAYTSPDGQSSMAGAATGGMGVANVNCGRKHVDVQGVGEVGHWQYAKNDNASAGTNGNATYSYNNHGSSHVGGYGGAVTGGMSKVTQNSNGVTASCKSVSFSVGN